MRAVIFTNNLLRKIPKCSAVYSNLWCSHDTRHYTQNIEPSASLVLNLGEKYKKHTEAIDQIIAKNPHLNSTQNISLWDNFVETLKSFGFGESDSFKIISSDPQVLGIPNHELTSVLTRWHQCNIGSDFIKFLILNNPSFLFVPLRVIETRIPLLSNFAKKPKSLVLLLLQCPNVLTEQWEEVAAKIEYMTNVMRVEKSEMLQSLAMAKSLTHIKVRHGILLKCGMYKTPSKYEHKREKNEKSAFRNPHLKRIVDNEDISFARKICKISHEEYETFRDMFEEDLLEDSEEELISDSDSDSDDERYCLLLSRKYIRKLGM